MGRSGNKTESRLFSASQRLTFDFFVMRNADQPDHQQAPGLIYPINWIAAAVLFALAITFRVTTLLIRIRCLYALFLWRITRSFLL
jgi:hypothetical protein